MKEKDILTLNLIVKMNEFEKWWYNIGSGIIPAKNEDHEEHTKRVCNQFFLYLKNPCLNCSFYSKEMKRKNDHCLNVCCDYIKGFDLL